MSRSIRHVFILFPYLLCANSLLVDLGPKRSYASKKVRIFATFNEGTETRRDEVKAQLLDLIAGTPSNMPTSKSVTNQILNVVPKMEQTCPTPDEDVVEKLGGNWELLWTAQDQSSDEWGLGPLRTWIK